MAALATKEIVTNEGHWRGRKEQEEEGMPRLTFSVTGSEAWDIEFGSDMDIRFGTHNAFCSHGYAGGAC